MKKLILSIIFASVALANVDAVPCKQEHNCYIQTTGSFGWHNKTRAKIAGVELSAKQKKGLGGAVAIGYIMEQWRLELEGSHRYNPSANKYGIKSNTSLMVNMLCDIPVTDLISIYLGAGAGISSVNGKTLVVKERDSRIVKFKKKRGHLDTVFAWQGMAGLSYAISDNVDLITGYRLFATAKPKVHNIRLSKVPVIHSVELGLRFKF